MVDRARRVRRYRERAVPEAAPETVGDVPAPTLAMLQERFGNAVVAQALAGGGDALGRLIQQAAADEAEGRSASAAGRFDHQAASGAMPTATTTDPAAAATPDDEARLQQLGALLADGEFSSPSPADLEQAAALADGLTPAGREAFAKLDGGAPCALLQAYLDGEVTGEPTLGDELAGEASDAANHLGDAGEAAVDYVSSFGEAFRSAASLDFAGAADHLEQAGADVVAVGDAAVATVGDAVSAVEEVGSAIGDAVAAVPTVGASGVSLSVDPLSGAAEVHLATFQLAGADVGGADVGSLSGTDGNARVDLGLSSSAVDLTAATLAVRDLVIPDLATIPELRATGVAVHAELAAALDPSALVLQQLGAVGSELWSSARSFFTDPPTFGLDGVDDAVASHLVGELGATVASLDLPQGVLGPDGQPLVAEVHATDLAVDAAFGDSLVMLRDERDALRGVSERTAAQEERLAWLDAELARLEPLAAERDALAARAVTLTPEEVDRLRELDEELHTATVSASAGQLDATGVDVGGVQGDVSATDASLSATAQLSPATEASASARADELGDALDARAGRETEPDLTGVDVELAAAEVSGSGAGSVGGVSGSGSGSATDVSVELAGDAVSARAEAVEAEDVAGSWDGEGEGSADAVSADDLALDGDLSAGSAELTVGRASASGVEGEAADGTELAAGELSAEDVAVGGTVDEQHASVGSVSASDAELALGSGERAAADELTATDLAAASSGETASFSIGGADAEGVSAAGYDAELAADHVSVGGVSGSSGPDGDQLTVDTASATGADIELASGEHARAEAITAGDLSASSGAGGEDLAIGSVDARGVSADDGANHVEIGHIGAESVDAHHDAAGSTVTIEHGEVDDVHGALDGVVDGDFDLDHAEVGHAGVALDAEGDVVGGCAEDLEALGIHVSLIGFDPDAVFGADDEDAPVEGAPVEDAPVEAERRRDGRPGKRPREPEAPPGPTPIHLEALDDASGVVVFRFPLELFGIHDVTVSVRAVAGVVSMRDVDVDVTGRAVIGSIARAVARLAASDTGFCIFVGSLAIRLVSGVRVDLGVTTPLRRVVEAVANGYVYAEVDEQALDEGEKRTVKEKLGEAMARRVDRAVVDGSALTIGDGAAGVDGVGEIVFDNGHDPSVNHLRIEGQLGESLHVGANRVAASELTATVGDVTVGAKDIGLEGLDVTVGAPLGDAHDIAVEVEGATVASVSFGDTSRIAS